MKMSIDHLEINFIKDKFVYKISTIKINDFQNNFIVVETLSKVVSQK